MNESVMSCAATVRRIAAALLCAGSTAVQAVPTCTVADTSTLAFGSIVALSTTGNVATNSGTSFWVNCTADVASTPSIYSSTTRALTAGTYSLPFNLSAVSAGGAELPTTSPGATLSITKNGTNQTVTLYGRVLASNFKSLPSGHYTGAITLTIVY